MAGLLAMALAGCASTGGVTAEAEGGIDRATSEKPVTSELQGKARTHVELGNAYLDAGRYGVALDEAKIAQAYDRNYAPGHLLMGLVYSFLEQHELATASFQQAERLAPYDPEVANAYGWYLCNRGRQAEGLVKLEQAARNPYYRFPARSLANAGLCELNRRNDKAAESYFQRSIQIDRNNPQVLYQLASIAYREGNAARARQWLTELQARMAAPAAETLWLGLRIERKLGNREGEARYAAQLKRDFPSSDEYAALTQGKFD
ncbi:type IV pilus biogenesis/stability protein PilW [Uliginosibacterium sp. H1]|uniref:type IV pilus biogenesis/stability protein PilW n=1 Tax=Uliginosibacterium sp. H1 TaxID=3114757 RepID=UPI002E18D6DF|nr:type IV pilus biogenesis/stability protein PilW [Uliginosibacterium sp. H1]